MDKFTHELARALQLIIDNDPKYKIELGIRLTAVRALRNYNDELEILKLGEGANTWASRPEQCPNCHWCSELAETIDHGWRCANCKWDSYHQFKKDHPNG